VSTPPGFAVAVASTSHFTFHALGRNAEHARAALLAAWSVHSAQTGADPDYLSADDINVYQGTPGTVFRDGTPIYTDDLPLLHALGEAIHNCGTYSRAFPHATDADNPHTAAVDAAARAAFGTDDAGEYLCRQCQRLYPRLDPTLGYRTVCCQAAVTITRTEPAGPPPASPDRCAECGAHLSEPHAPGCPLDADSDHDPSPDGSCEDPDVTLTYHATIHITVGNGAIRRILIDDQAAQLDTAAGGECSGCSRTLPTDHPPIADAAAVVAAQLDSRAGWEVSRPT
jgi:hypothetical protein